MSIKSEVKQLLTDHPRYRDDRDFLIETYFTDKGISIFDANIIRKFFREASNVDRAWRQIQQQNPELRGQDYERRHNVLQPEKQKESQIYENQFSSLT